MRAIASPTLLAIAGVALVLALVGLLLDPRQFFASWLAAWWFLLGVMLGSLVNLWMHRLSGGRWGQALRPAALLVPQRLPWLLLLFLPLAIGMPLLYPWMASGNDWSSDIARPAFAQFWLQPDFFWLRALVYGLLWWWISRPPSAATKGRAAASIALYLLTGTLAAVDLLMSLVPGWFSTAFGLVVLSGQAIGGTALCVLLLAPCPLAVSPAPSSPPLWRDFGNLLLMWVMVWAYLAFMEFLIIWSENLPYEIAWFVPRLSTGWRWIGLALALLLLGLPLLALLQRRLKDRPERLAPIAALMLVMQLVNSAWLVLPSVAPHGLLGWILVPLLTLAMGLPLFGHVPHELAAKRATIESTTEARHARS